MPEELKIIFIRFIYWMPYIIAGGLFARGRVIVAAIVMALSFFTTSIIAKSITDDKLRQQPWVSAPKRDEIRSFHQSWKTRMGIGMAWLIAALLYGLFT